MPIWVVDPALIALVFLLILYFLSPGHVNLKKPVQYPILVFLLLMALILLSCIYTSSLAYYSEKLYKTSIVLIAFFIPILWINNSKDLEFVVPIINSYALIAAIIVIMMFIRDGNIDILIYPEKDGRIPDYLSISMLLGGAIMLNLSKDSSLITAYKVLLFIAMILLGGRSTFLLVIFMGTCFLIFKYCKNFKKLLLVFLLLTAGVIAFNSWKGSKLIINRLNVMTGHQGNQSVEARVDFFYKSLDMIAERPLTGFGYGSFANEVIHKDSRLTAHNIFLEIAVETGLFGGLLLVIFFILVFRLFLQTEPGEDEIFKQQLMLTIAFLLCMSIGSNYFSDSKHLFGFIGLFLAFKNLIKSNHDTSDLLFQEQQNKDYVTGLSY